MNVNIMLKSNTVEIGCYFPDNWTYGQYEQAMAKNIISQINNKFSLQKNLFINMTWFGPQFNNEYNQVLKFKEQGIKFDNLFLLATVDPPMITSEQIQVIAAASGVSAIYQIGNFDSNYEFNFFAIVCAEKFVKYKIGDIILKDPKHLYINYNRKPRKHRVDFVKQLIKHNLIDQGIVTLGRPNVIFDKSDDNNLYLTIGEDPADYVEQGHWFNGPDEFGIPHDLFSLHNIDYWQHHFLHICGSTEFNSWDNIFVNQIEFKPLIGLRPFVINGQTTIYQWLQRNGFKTFNHYFDAELENIPEHQIHNSIIAVIKQLSNLDHSELISMYNDMLPDLLHNRRRFFEFAQEQHYKLNNLF